MKFQYKNLENCHEATGVVIVIDVLRAFSNAAYAFSRGAKEMYTVSSVEEALLLRDTVPNSFISGEVGGLPPKGFDFGNSPTQTSQLDLDNKIIFIRTGAWTQGIVKSINASTMLAASFVVVNATVKYVRNLKQEMVTFVITGQYAPGHGDEDVACAEYLELLFTGEQPNPTPFIDRVYKSQDAFQHLDPKETEFPLSDLDLCTKIDAFDFAMLVERENNRHILRTIYP